LIDVADLPVDVEIERALPAPPALQVFWKDAFATSFSLEWLYRQSNACCVTPRPHFWKPNNVDVLGRFSYPQVRASSKYRLEWLRAIAARGIAFLENVPPFDGQAAEIASFIGWIRETNYGRIFDVIALPNPNNLAYTERALGLHTDNPYRDPVPGLQILHALKTAEGGESLFADGFAIAEALRKSDLESFNVLTSTPVRFEFADSQTRLSAERPIIELDRNSAVSAIQYNSRSISPLRLPFDATAKFYRAYHRFASLLREPCFVATTTLREGDAVVFNNRRVLHGRTAFAADAPRHLQGCYLEADGLLSNITVLEVEQYA
jgi:gamma-butyrobetaine dioxygenase